MVNYLPVPDKDKGTESEVDSFILIQSLPIYKPQLDEMMAHKETPLIRENVCSNINL